MQASDKSHRPRPSRRGIALTLVIILMAVAAMLAYSMLANAIVQSQVAANQIAGARADALAESGVELAMYYLQYPKHAPILAAVSGTVPPYWAGGSNLTFPNLSGKATVTIAPDGTSGTLFSISSTGTYTSASGAALSKTVSAVAQVNYTFQVKQAVTSSTNLGLGQNAASQVMTVNQTAGATANALNAFGAVALGKKANVLGQISATGVSGTGTWSNMLVAAPSFGMAPPINQVRSYATYNYNGVASQAGALPSILNIINLVLALLGLGGNPNPLNIIYNGAGSVTLTGPLTINGTVYVPNGSVTITNAVTINSQATGFPALVAGQQILMSAGATLTANGLTYAGTGIGPGGNAASGITVNGALLLGSPSLDSGYKGTLNVNYSSTLASAPDFTSDPIYMTPQSVKLISWSP